MTARDLARELLGRRTRPRDEQYALLLGKGCSRSAGNPYEQVISKFVSQFAGVGSKVGGALALVGPAFSGFLLQAASHPENLPEKLFALFPENARHTAELTIYRLLRQYYVNLPVPLFYKDLAAMLKAGYFSRVLTTNYDNLLEQALESAPTPLRRDRDYTVINVPALRRTALKEQLADLRKDTLLILKLHGDLLQDNADLDLADNENALVEHRKAMFGQFSYDLVAVGYERESPGVDKALHAQSGGRIWWVSETGLEPEFQPALRAIRPLDVIDGPGANPDQFFGDLWTMLSRAPELCSKSEHLTADEAAEIHSESERALSSDTLEPILLSDRLARAQDDLERLRQSSPPGLNPDVEAQIEYQRQQIFNLEDEIRLQHKDKILSLLGQLSLTKADAEVKDFVGRQTAVIEGQLQSEKPNQRVISAALAAVTILACRPDEQIASAETIQALRAFVPSAIGRGA